MTVRCENEYVSQLDTNERTTDSVGPRYVVRNEIGFWPNIFPIL